MAVLGSPSLGGPTFSVSFPASLRAEPATGRLVVYLVREGSRVGGAAPADGPFWDDPQPMYGADAVGAPPDRPIPLDDAATSFPVRLSELPPGVYRAQAVLDLSRLDSSWRREPGNLFSRPVSFTFGAGESPTVEIPLTEAVPPRRGRHVEGVEIVEVRSELLSAFHGRDVMLRAGVVFPARHDPARAYAAVYEVPGFGGTHEGAYGIAADRRRTRDGPHGTLAASTFWIVLDPESGNGHTLFADSANNGPRGEALVKELVPALEAKYNLIAEPSARLLRGHSSGGWSTLWLALTYPETFGAAWSTSPDPVDFRRFQLPDIYHYKSMYFPTVLIGEAPVERLREAMRQEKTPLPSYRSDGEALMTIQEENLMEEVLGPDNTSGQQWDSWFAVFGPRSERGNPAALFDPKTGLLDRAIAEQYRRCDIADLVRNDAGRYGLVFKQRVRLLVGNEDNFYLNEAVALLKTEVDGLSFLRYPEGEHGFIKVLAGYDHGTIFGSPELRAIPEEMVEHLRRAGHVR